MAYSTPSQNPPPNVSSYRVKFDRTEFLRLVKIAKPDYIFVVKNMLFFAFQGFVVYSLDCRQDDLIDLHIQILEAKEFSNSTWKKS